MKGFLVFEDGTIFEGTTFGCLGTSAGEICFNTSMTGYEEIITDPSYRGQIVTFTYSQIGNYGINEEDFESSEPQVRGIVVNELSSITANFRAKCSVAELFQKHNLLGIAGIDTRSIAKKLRTEGVMRACITNELSAEEAVQRAQATLRLEEENFVAQVSPQQVIEWQGEARRWRLPNINAGIEGYYHDLPEIKYHVTVFDFGIKRNILRSLAQIGCRVTLLPYTTTAETVRSLQPDLIFLSNGPGDPSTLVDVYKEVKQLANDFPIVGICLGHQILTHVFGGKTYKLKFGHRGANHPVKELRTGKVLITSQNHGFATDDKTFPEELEVTHRHLNDNTIEGLKHRHLPIFSVQHHPEAAPGPSEAGSFFADVLDLLQNNSYG